MTIGQQLERIYSARLATIGSSLNETAVEITEQMKENTKAGRGFVGSSSDLYNNNYSRKYARWREKRGLQSQTVTLRAKNLRIERTTLPENTENSVEIGFQDGGKIFKYHQDGTARGNKIRSIFPQFWSSVPSDIYQRMIANIVGALRG